MAKKLVIQVKVQITAGQATPAPPVGTSLGPHGINLGKFVQEFNERTKSISGTIVPVIVSVYNDRSFEFIVKTPPASILIKQAAQVAKGSGSARAAKVGAISQAQLQEIARTKMVDLNTASHAAACKIIAGTARSMGVDIVS